VNFFPGFSFVLVAVKQSKYCTDFVNKMIVFQIFGDAMYVVVVKKIENA